jgi:hypothetical protein
MRRSRALTLIFIGYVGWSTRARAEEPCTTGPFETDVRAIAAAESRQWLKASDWQEGQYWGEPKQLSDGANWSWSGGLLNTQGHRLTYDAKRYVVVGSTIEFDQRKARDIPPARGIQVISRRRDGTFVRTVSRPTPDEARQFACLANQLLSSPVKRAPPFSQDLAGATPTTSFDLSMAPGPSAGCSEYVRDSEEGSDEWSSSFELVHAGSIAKYGGSVPCAFRAAIIDNMEGLIRVMLEKATDKWHIGKWYAP